MRDYPPEGLDNCSDKWDVYLFGVLLFQMVAPDPRSSPSATILSNCDPEITKIIEICLHQMESRPGFVVVTLLISLWLQKFGKEIPLQSLQNTYYKVFDFVQSLPLKDDFLRVSGEKVLQDRIGSDLFTLSADINISEVTSEEKSGNNQALLLCEYLSKLKETEASLYESSAMVNDATFMEKEKILYTIRECCKKEICTRSIR